MRITCEVEQSLAKDFAKLAEAMADTSRGVARDVAQATAKHMRSTHRYTDRTGRLTRAMRARLHAMTNRGASWLFYVDVAVAPHAIFVDRGTLPHRIEGNEWLAFEWPKVGPGTFFFRGVNHPGTKSYAIEDDAQEFAESIIEGMMGDAVTRTLARFAR